jgi:hypothetical protein
MTLAYWRVARLGLAKTLFLNHERDTEKGRERAIGVLMSRHFEEHIVILLRQHLANTSHWAVAQPTAWIFRQALVSFERKTGAN